MQAKKISLWTNDFRSFPMLHAIFWSDKLFVWTDWLWRFAKIRFIESSWMITWLHYIEWLVAIKRKMSGFHHITPDWQWQMSKTNVLTTMMSKSVVKNDSYQIFWFGTKLLEEAAMHWIFLNVLIEWLVAIQRKMNGFHHIIR